MRDSVDGLVLLEEKTGNHDKILTVLSARDGTFRMMAKGVRSKNHRLASICCLFSYANFEYYKKKETRWLADGVSIRQFRHLTSDADGASLAAYVLQIANEITGSEVEAGEILRTTLNILHAIDQRLKPMSQIKAAYELFAVRAAGMSPDLSGCHACGEQLPDRGWFDVMNGHFFCEDCFRKKQGGLPIPEEDALRTRNIFCPIDSSALAAMRYLEAAPPTRLLAFGLSDEESMRLLSNVAETFLIHHLERGFSALQSYYSAKDLDQYAQHYRKNTDNAGI